MKRGKDYIGVGVGIVVFNDEGKLLITKRGQACANDRGKWEIPGGGVEHGELRSDAVKREIKEEYCTDVLGYEFLGFRDVHRNNKGKDTHWISLDFKVHIDRTQAKIGEPEKIDEIGWFPKRGFPTPLHSQLPFFLEKYKDKI